MPGELDSLNFKKSFFDNFYELVCFIMNKDPVIYSTAYNITSDIINKFYGNSPLSYKTILDEKEILLSLIEQELNEKFKVQDSKKQSLKQGCYSSSREPYKTSGKTYNSLFNDIGRVANVHYNDFIEIKDIPFGDKNVVPFLTEKDDNSNYLQTICNHSHQILQQHSQVPKINLEVQMPQNYKLRSDNNLVKNGRTYSIHRNNHRCRFYQ